jgi:hypothetical protein
MPDAPLAAATEGSLPGHAVALRFAGFGPPEVLRAERVPLAPASRGARRWSRCALPPSTRRT